MQVKYKKHKRNSVSSSGSGKQAVSPMHSQPPSPQLLDKPHSSSSDLADSFKNKFILPPLVDSSDPKQAANGINILRAALTGSPEVRGPLVTTTTWPQWTEMKNSFQIPQQYRSIRKPVLHHSLGRNAACYSLISELIACDEFEDIATLKVSHKREDLILEELKYFTIH